jgi:hypothetical protein
MKNEILAVGNLIQIIRQSRQNALKKVNEEFKMYFLGLRDLTGAAYIV